MQWHNAIEPIMYEWLIANDKFSTFARLLDIISGIIIDDSDVPRAKDRKKEEKKNYL